MRVAGSPQAIASIGLVAIGPDLLDRIRQAVSAEAVLPAESIGFDHAVDNILRAMPDVVLVGIGGNTDAAVRFAREVKAHSPNIALIAVADHRDADTILTAMRAGFAEYTVLPDDADQLREAISKAAQAKFGNNDSAMVVTVLGAKGGVGTTLIATHLATELAAIHRVLCIDLDSSMGDVATMMNVTVKDSIIDLLNRTASVDERVLSGMATVHPSKVHILGQPDSLGDRHVLNPDRMFDVISAAAQGYQYVVIDGGVNLDDTVATAARVSDHVLLVTTPDIVSVRNAHRQARALTMQGVDKRHIHLIINQNPRQPYLTAEKIETSLGIRVVGIIPQDSRRVDEAINEGGLLRDLHPNSEIVVALARLVGLLSEDPEDMQAVQTESKGGLFSRFFGGSAKK